ncbi:MAG: hypothetical protein Q7T55_06530 [Solirubrobacteraceae bacterium]|nr:hypothetical protein [Solirubrobacteraceae bacterium]
MATRKSKPPTEDAPDDLPASLRTVLYSPTKAELLRLIEEHGPVDAGVLIEKLRTPMHRNSINLHLRELESAGWITVDSVKQNRGGFGRIWDLTSRDRSWIAFLTLVRDQAPVPVLSEPATEFST